MWRSAGRLALIMALNILTYSGTRINLALQARQFHSCHETPHCPLSSVPYIAPCYYRSKGRLHIPSPSQTIPNTHFYICCMANIVSPSATVFGVSLVLVCIPVTGLTAIFILECVSSSVYESHRRITSHHIRSKHRSFRPCIPRPRKSTGTSVVCSIAEHSPTWMPILCPSS